MTPVLLMTLSPIENDHLSLHSALALRRSEAPVLVGGLVTRPLFGWFGSATAGAGQPDRPISES